jgi:hypothetical protein
MRDAPAWKGADKIGEVLQAAVILQHRDENCSLVGFRCSWISPVGKSIANGMKSRVLVLRILKLDPPPGTVGIVKPEIVAQPASGLSE